MITKVNNSKIINNKNYIYKAAALVSKINHIMKI